MKRLEFLTQEENVKYLAALMVQAIEEPDYRHDYDSNLTFVVYDRYYITSDEERFDVYEYNKAIDHQIEWLLDDMEE